MDRIKKRRGFRIISVWEVMFREIKAEVPYQTGMAPHLTYLLFVSISFFKIAVDFLGIHF